MARKRVITVGGEKWTCEIGRGSVKFRPPNKGKTTTADFSQITGRSWDTIERGNWKKTRDGMVTPLHLEKYIVAHLNGKRNRSKPKPKSRSIKRIEELTSKEGHREIATFSDNVDLHIDDHNLLMLDAFFSFSGGMQCGIGYIIDMEFVKGLMQAAGVERLRDLSGRSLYVVHKGMSFDHEYLRFEPIRGHGHEVFDVVAWKKRKKEKLLGKRP